MILSFSARIDGPRIRCRIASDTALAAPVFCFSLMTPTLVLSGGTRIASLGGYTEVALPDLAPGVEQEVVLEPEKPAFTPKNRAWLPLGAYLRHAGGCTDLPALPAGVTQVPAPAPRAATEPLALVPPPNRWLPAGGSVDLSRGLATGHEAFATVAEIGVESRIAALPFLSDNGLAVEIETDPALAPEAYRLTLAAEGIRIAAAERAGIFYAAITLRHLQITHAGRPPAGEIQDAPRFGWRGQHLDCARHFYAPETIRQLFDLMALMKLNRFHWHFADDEAFRLEVDCCPELWQKTAFRGEGELIPGVFGGGIRAGGSYSKADVAALVDHAARLNIEILPEIEVPAHALALNLAVPGLRDPADTGAEESVQGYRENTVNPAIPEMWRLTEALADEVAALFPFGHLHLGCDELPEDTWAGSPAVAALKAREGLSTTDDVQGWTMARIAGHLARQGIRPAAWEEAARGANGGLGHGAILFSWTGQGPGVAAARAGYDVVMCPAQHIYLDMAHSIAEDDWGARWAAAVGLEDTVDWRVLPEGAEDIAKRVIGIESTFWSEFTTEDSELWPMLMPRLLGVAAKAWCPEAAIDGAQLRRLADDYRAGMAGFWSWHYGA